MAEENKCKICLLSDLHAQYVRAQQLHSIMHASSTNRANIELQVCPTNNSSG